MNTQRQLLAYRNEIKNYLPRATRKQMDYIVAEHTSWPIFSDELCIQQVARYMAIIGVKRCKVSTKSVGEKRKVR